MWLRYSAILHDRLHGRVAPFGIAAGLEMDVIPHQIAFIERDRDRHRCSYGSEQVSSDRQGRRRKRYIGGAIPCCLGFDSFQVRYRLLWRNLQQRVVRSAHDHQ
jgi:hypothetical protein